MKKIKRIDARWWAITSRFEGRRPYPEGFWFDGTLRFLPWPESRYLTELRDSLYGAIFLAGGGRDRCRAQRLAALECFLGNLVVSVSRLSRRSRRGAVIIHLNKNRWAGLGHNYHHIVKVFRYFKANRLIVIRRGWLNRRTKEGRVTRMIASHRLVDQLCGCVTRNEAEFYIASRPDRPVVLKNADGVPVAYPVSGFVRDLTTKINRVNAVNSSFTISFERPETGRRWPVNPYVYAVFNRDWKTAGRFYGSRHSHVNMTEQERRSMLIAGEPIAELDYASLHLNLLYAKVRARFRGADPYTCVLAAADDDDGLRDVLKEILLSLLNDKCSEQALVAHVEYRMLRRHVSIDRYRHPLAWEDAATECRRNRRLLRKHRVSVPEIVTRFKRAHARIARFFHAGTWGEMQNVDSRIALEVMTNLVRRGLPCLPRHDSFITQARHAGILKTAMQAAYGTVTSRLYGSPFPIQIKREI
jgi:hypothetical protein